MGDWMFPVKDYGDIDNKIDTALGLNPLVDGESCGHPGCLNHVTTPCEWCGRIAGQKAK